MLNYQATETSVNLTFSKEHLNSQELLRLLEILRIKELLSQSQARFLAKIQTL